MQETYSEFIGKIIASKRKIESTLGVKITNKGMIVFINGPGEKEFIASKVIDAINVGFSVERALLLKDEEIILQIINIKGKTKRNDLERIRGRIIGSDGKTLKILNNLTDCFVSVHNNQVGIIGDAEDIYTTVQSIESIIRGSKQANVYARLEKEKKKKRIDEKIHLNERRHEHNEE
ncbi:MAG: hypothetical protein AABW67_02305 [Nanoarchaeota archaeon]